MSKDNRLTYWTDSLDAMIANRQAVIEAIVDCVGLDMEGVIDNGHGFSLKVGDLEQDLIVEFVEAGDQGKIIVSGEDYEYVMMAFEYGLLSVFNTLKHSF